MKTFVLKEGDIVRKWYVVDAAGQTLGRFASKVAQVLRGKQKPIYSPHLDVGDYVIVVNAEKIVVTGKKLDQKMYHHHSGYPGGLKSINLRDQLKRHPTFAVKHAIRGMLPKRALGRRMLKKLKVYAGPDHEHHAQNPLVLEL